MPTGLIVTLVRHGSAEPSAYRDRARALTLAGRQEARDVGAALRQAIPLPGLLVSSPLVRAVQTAELLAVALEYRGGVLIDRALRPESAPDGVIDLLVALASRTLAGVALVAHEPILSSVCQLLLGTPVPALRRAEAVCLSWDAGSRSPARLLWKGCPS